MMKNISWLIYLALSFPLSAMALGPTADTLVSHCEAIECVPATHPFEFSDCDTVWANLMPRDRDYITAKECYAEALSFARDLQINGWASYLQWHSGRGGISLGYPSGYLSETSSDIYGTGDRIGKAINLRTKIPAPTDKN